uniref:Uncharacterized protein n=1 Tax=Tetraselmis sp. GSL018 TaxID=582737 RepID=A0A061S6X8_9CHLO
MVKKQPSLVEAWSLKSKQHHAPSFPEESSSPDNSRWINRNAPEFLTNAGNPTIAAPQSSTATTRSGYGSWVTETSNLCRSAVRREAFGYMGSGALDMAMNLACDSYSELPPVPFTDDLEDQTQYLFHLPSSSTRAPTPSISFVEFDTSCDLCASASCCGGINIYDFASLRNASQSAARGGMPRASAAPLLALRTQRQLSSLRWDPRNQNMIASVADTDRTVALHDLQYCGNRPTEELHFRGPGALGWAHGSVGLRSALGFADVQFIGGVITGGYSIAAAGSSGCVALWDVRKGRYAATALTAPPTSGGLHSLNVTQDGLVVLSGTERGEIAGWDIRGGRSGGRQFGAGGAYLHPLLFCTPVTTVSRGIHGAEESTDSGATSCVHCLAVDAYRSDRIAFLLSGGQIGLFDFQSLTARAFSVPQTTGKDPCCDASSNLTGMSWNFPVPASENSRPTNSTAMNA